SCHLSPFHAPPAPQLSTLSLHDALPIFGAAYVKQTFTPAARRRALAMVDNLIAALDDRLRTLEWMSDTTRVRALEKLRAFGRKRSEEHTSELQSRGHLVCRLLLEKKKQR